eukprot:5198209-Pyramimonas_sp.AAC.4
MKFLTLRLDTTKARLLCGTEKAVVDAHPQLVFHPWDILRTGLVKKKDCPESDCTSRGRSATDCLCMRAHM